MLKNISITNFKILENENIDFKTITVLCGENSSGKSTVVLASLLANDIFNPPSPFKEYIDLRIKDINDCTITYLINKEKYTVKINMRDNSVTGYKQTENIKYSFLSADRIGPRDIYPNPSTNDTKIDIYGKHTAYILNKLGRKNILKKLLKGDSSTLFDQVNYWLQEILNTSFTLEENGNNIKIYYQNHINKKVSPLNTGFGTSMILPILVTCLTAKRGETVIIENPEIHLHPKAQAKLGDFFAWIAKSGIQLIIETHCEHLINKLCYNVFSKTINKNDLVIYYKELCEPFKKINVDEKGKFIDQAGKPMPFPANFFDVSVDDYLAMYR